MYGIRVRELRRQRGLTQRQLGRLCGVSGAVIGQVERGERLRLRLAQGGIVCEVKEKDYGGEKDV